MYERGTRVKVTKRAELARSDAIKVGDEFTGTLLTGGIQVGYRVMVANEDNDSGPHLWTGTVKVIRLRDNGVEFDTKRSSYYMERAPADLKLVKNPTWGGASREE